MPPQPRGRSTSSTNCPAAASASSTEESSPRGSTPAHDVGMPREVTHRRRAPRDRRPPRCRRRQQGEGPAVRSAAGLAVAFAARIRRHHRRRRPRRRLTQGRPAGLRPRHRRHHDRHPRAAGQQARRRLPQRAAAPTGRHGVPHPRSRGHPAHQRHRHGSWPTPTTSTRWPSAASDRSSPWRSTSTRSSSTARRRSCARTPGSRRRGIPTAVPSVAQLAKAIKPDMSDEQLEEYYAEDNHAEDPVLEIRESAGVWI